jgi:ElaB/YqjD/DUF883 family membrane-anchored ribosome-binding protein
MNDAAKSLNDLGKGPGRSASGDLDADNAYLRLEKDITTVKTEIARLSDQIADAVNALGVIAQSETRRGFKRARANVNALASDASERAGAAAGAVSIAAQDAANSIGDTLSDAIEERPVASIALAMGIGFLVGAAWRR